MVAKVDSNPGSLDCESGVRRSTTELPRSRCKIDLMGMGLEECTTAAEDRRAWRTMTEYVPRSAAIIR